MDKPVPLVNRLVVPATLIIAFIVLSVRSYGAFSSIMPDEYFFSKYARLLPFSQAEIPGYFYYFVYSISSIWTDYYLDVARFLNAFFYVLGCYFAYLTSRLFLPIRWATIVLIVSLFMPANFYVAYFMPESMYFSIFWIMQYMIMRNDKYDLVLCVFAGVFYGLLILVKPHALFLIPVILTFFIIKNGINKSGLRVVLVFVLAFILTRILIGISLAGFESLTLFGVSYTQHANLAVGGISEIILAIKDYLLVILAHVFFLGFLFGVSINDSIKLFISKSESRVKDIILMLWLHIMLMVPLVSLFTITASLFGDDWTYRVHMRYYIFIFPYFFMITVYSFANLDWKHNNPTKIQAIIAAITMILPIGILYYYTLNKYFYPFAVGIADVPEIFLLTHDSTLFYIICVASLLSIFLWLIRPGLGRAAYLCLFLPIYLMIVWYNHGPVNTARYKPRDVDIVGQYMRNQIDRSIQDSTLVVGYREMSLYAILMYSNSDKIRHQPLSTTKPFVIEDLPSDIKYIMALDSIDLRTHADPLWSNDGSVFYRIRD